MAETEYNGCTVCQETCSACPTTHSRARKGRESACQGCPDKKVPGEEALNAIPRGGRPKNWTDPIDEILAGRVFIDPSAPKFSEDRNEELHRLRVEVRVMRFMLNAVHVSNDLIDRAVEEEMSR